MNYIVNERHTNGKAQSQSWLVIQLLNKKMKVLILVWTNSCTDESHENNFYILILHSEFVYHERAYNNEGVHLTRDALIWISQLVTSLCFRISFSAYFLHRLSVANLSSLMHRWQVIFQSTEPLTFRGHEGSMNQAYVLFIPFFVFGFWSLLATKLRKYKNNM